MEMKGPEEVGLEPGAGQPGFGQADVRPSPSKRRVELPLGFEPIFPVGADGLPPRLPALVGEDRDPFAGGASVSPTMTGRRRVSRRSNRGPPTSPTGEMEVMDALTSVKALV